MGAFDFPLSFWLAFLLSLRMLSILSCGGHLILFFSCCFFFFFKGCEDSLPLAVDSLRVGWFWNIFLQYLPHGISWGQLTINWITSPCELRCLCTGDQVVVTENVHKVAALCLPNTGSWGSQILRASWLPGVWNRGECAWARRKGLETHCFPPKASHKHPVQTNAFWVQSTLLRAFRCLGSCPLRKQAYAGNPSARRGGG